MSLFVAAPIFGLRSTLPVRLPGSSGLSQCSSVTERFESPDLIAVTAEDPAPDYATAIFAVTSEGNDSGVDERRGETLPFTKVENFGRIKKWRQLLTHPS
jgi:hypothetical protein